MRRRARRPRAAAAWSNMWGGASQSTGTNDFRTDFRYLPYTSVLTTYSLPYLRTVLTPLLTSLLTHSGDSCWAARLDLVGRRFAVL